MSPLTRRGFLALLSGPLASGTWTEAASLHVQPGPAGVPARLESRRLALHRDSCLAWGGTDCVACYIACPLRGRALVFEHERPQLDLDVCTGCGDCVPVCHTVNDRGALRWENAPPADPSRTPAAA